MERTHSMLKLFQQLNKLSGYLAAALLWVLSFLIFADVLLRFSGTPILWSNEISVYLLIAVVFLGVGYTYDCDGHFSITLLVEKLPRAPRIYLELAVVLLSLVFAVLLTWGGIELVRFARSLNLASPTLLHVPLYLPYLAVCVGGFSLVLSLITRAVTLVIALRSGADVALRTEHSI